MSHPLACKAFRRTAGKPPFSIELTTESLPSTLGPTQVLLRVHAVSLNFRDVAMLDGSYPMQLEDQGVVASDAAAEVVSVGDNVSEFKAGDRVSPVFDLSNLTGEETSESITLGGNGPGVLREYAIFDQSVLVHLPRYLSWVEASTLACAGVTAWNALNLPATASKDKRVLLQGTGGVSMYALLLALAAGIRPIITSSSDEKAASIRELAPEGMIQTVNYKTSVDWHDEVMRETGDGVDIVVNNIGIASLTKDVAVLRRHGRISLVGFLGGLNGTLDSSFIVNMLQRQATIRSLRVGSKADFQQLIKFLESKKLQLDTLVDKVFTFEQTKEAYEYLRSGKHTGKVVITI